MQNDDDYTAVSVLPPGEYTNNCPVSAMCESYTVGMRVSTRLHVYTFTCLRLENYTILCTNMAQWRQDKLCAENEQVYLLTPMDRTTLPHAHPTTL